MSEPSYQNVLDQVDRAIARDQGEGNTGAEEVVRSAIERIKADGAPGPAMEKATIEALATLAVEDPSTFANLRHELKGSHPGVLIAEVSRAVDVAKREIFPSESSDDRALADLLIAEIERRGDLFHDGESEPHICINADTHREIHHLQTKTFREWLSWTCYSILGKAPSDNVVAQTITALSGRALHDGDEHPVYLRAAPDPGGDGYWIDLCNTAWEAIHVTPMNWEIVAAPAVRFRRTQAMRPLPSPEKDGSFNQLWRLANIPIEYRVLVVTWILECWRQSTPFPILELIGGQGTGKSDTQDRLRDLVDPNAVNLRAAPKDVESIHVGAGSNWLVSYNNLSRVTPAAQDALCALSTGGGHASRTLYTNRDETIIESKRPVILNGITPLGTAQDMIDRSIRLELPIITTRRKDADLKAEFKQARPSILGWLLDLFVKVLAVLPGVEIKDPPRLADFAELGEAVRLAMGEQNSFAEVYANVRQRAITQGIEASPAALAMLDYAESKSPGQLHSGTIKTLLRKLEAFKGDADAWPRSARGLSEILRRQAPALQSVGIEVTFDPVRRMDGYHVAVQKHSLPEGKKSNDVHDVHEAHEVQETGGIHERYEHHEHVSRVSPLNENIFVEEF